MNKTKKNYKKNYQCSNCDYSTVKWLGCCPSCNNWGTLKEEEISKTIDTTNIENSLTFLSEVSSNAQERYKTGIKEWDRVTGNGLVPGSFIVVTGDPGIGKSTLLLQVSYSLSENNKVIYFSTEESLEQVKLRAQRLSCINNKLIFSDHANLENIIAIAKKEKPEILIIDSVQNCYLQDTTTIPGSIAQLKECTFKLMRLAKENNITVILTGHITKEGIIAGPKTLEHMVDAVFYLQGEDKWQTRVLRSVKNRFGTVHELGFFQMESNGMQEVANINQQLLEEVNDNPGSILISYIEGSRPLLLELQSLTLTSKFGIPQRVVSGVDQRELVLIAAILEKYLQVKLSTHDIFFKISGSFKIKKGSGIDLGIALALLSSYFQKPLPSKSLALGEISLTGQIKPVNFINIHAGEAEKFGLETLLIAKNQKIKTSCKVIKFHNVFDLLRLFDD